MRVPHIQFLRRDPPDIPLLRLTVSGAPHRRATAPGPAASPRESRAAGALLDAYRICLVFAARSVGLRKPVREPIDLEISFLDPTSPDLDNLIGAFYQAADGGRHGRYALMWDDSLIQKVTMQKLCPADWQESNPARLQLARVVA